MVDKRWIEKLCHVTGAFSNLECRSKTSRVSSIPHVANTGAMSCHVPLHSYCTAGNLTVQPLGMCWSQGFEAKLCISYTHHGVDSRVCHSTKNMNLVLTAHDEKKL